MHNLHVKSNTITEGLELVFKYMLSLLWAYEFRQMMKVEEPVSAMKTSSRFHSVVVNDV